MTNAEDPLGAAPSAAAAPSIPATKELRTAPTRFEVVAYWGIIAASCIGVIYSMAKQDSFWVPLVGGCVLVLGAYARWGTTTDRLESWIKNPRLTAVLALQVACASVFASYASDSKYKSDKKIESIKIMGELNGVRDQLMVRIGHYGKRMSDVFDNMHKALMAAEQVVDIDRNIREQKALDATVVADRFGEGSEVAKLLQDRLREFEAEASRKMSDSMSECLGALDVAEVAAGSLAGKYDIDLGDVSKDLEIAVTGMAPVLLDFRGSVDAYKKNLPKNAADVYEMLKVFSLVEGRLRAALARVNDAMVLELDRKLQRVKESRAKGN